VLVPPPSLDLPVPAEGKAAAQALHECCVAAALMAAGLVALRHADTRAFRTLQALATSLAISSGYAQTARRAATGEAAFFSSNRNTARARRNSGGSASCSAAYQGLACDVLAAPHPHSLSQELLLMCQATTFQLPWSLH